MDSPPTKILAPNPFIELDDDVVTLHVGAGDKRRHFAVSRSLLCDQSPVLKAKLDQGLVESVVSFDLVQDNPDIFAEFLRWLCASAPCSDPASLTPGTALPQTSDFAIQLGLVRRTLLLEVLEGWKRRLINQKVVAQEMPQTSLVSNLLANSSNGREYLLFTSNDLITVNFGTILERLKSNFFSSTAQIDVDMRTLRRRMIVEFGRESKIVEQCEMIAKDIERHIEWTTDGSLQLGILAEKYQVPALADICMSEMLPRIRMLPPFTILLSTYKTTTEGSKFRSFLIRAFIYQVSTMDYDVAKLSIPALETLMFDHFEFSLDVFKVLEENGRSKANPLLLPMCDFHQHAKHEPCPAATKKTVTAPKMYFTTKVAATPKKRERPAEESPVNEDSDSSFHEETTPTTPQASTFKRKKI